MGWLTGLLFGALIGVGAWVATHDAGARTLSGESFRAGAPAAAGEDRPLPMFRPTRAPGSEPGSEGDERQIRPPVQRGPDDFYRKPPRERKPRDKMYA